jgi:hypothetical protein
MCPYPACPNRKGVAVHVLRAQKTVENGPRSAKNAGKLAPYRDAQLCSTGVYSILLATTSLHFGPHLMPLLSHVNSKNSFFFKIVVEVCTAASGPISLRPMVLFRHLFN